MTDSKSKSRGKPRPSEHAGRRTPEIIFSNSNTESEAEADSETEPESETKSQSQSESESELSESNNEGDSDDSEPARPVIDVSPRRQTSRRAVAPEHGQILMSALLETWVKTMYYNASPADQKRLFGQFVYHMGALGVNFGDTASDDFAEARKHYLASAEQFGKQILRGNPQNVQQFMENTLVRARRGSLASLEDVKRTSTLQAQDPGFLPATPTYIRPSILKEDYIEYEVLGKGSFGLVTKVVHKLDRSEYALKKVRLTTTSLRINGRGDVELGWRRILKEVRTLAKLDHSNIVRYYSSWIEDGNVVQTPTAVPQLDDSEEEEVPNDRPVGPPFPKGWPNVIYDPDKEAPPPLPRRRCIMNLNKPSKLDLQLAVANEDKEGALVPQTPMTQSRFAEPNNLTLHIVMALYNMSLKDFLVKRMDLEDGCAPAVHHCFCPRASLEILQAMVDGVEYLHENGITHRDLKPANVMLQVQDKSRRIACCEKGGFSVIPKISDFGVIENFDPRNPDLIKEPTEKQNGTVWYMPPEQGNHPKVDVWALGVILVELLYQFGTVNEQSSWFDRFTINNTRKGRFPETIASDEHGLLSIVEGCCHRDPELRWSIPLLKQQVKEAFEWREEKEAKKGGKAGAGDGNSGRS